MPAHPTQPAAATPRGRLATGVLSTLARRTALRSYRPRPRRSGSGTGGTCSSPTARTSPCPTRPESLEAAYLCAHTGARGRLPSGPRGPVCCCRHAATRACHDLAIAPYAGKGTGETTLLREMYNALKPGDVVPRRRPVRQLFPRLRELTRPLWPWRSTRPSAKRGRWKPDDGGRPDSDIILWPRPNKPLARG